MNFKGTRINMKCRDFQYEVGHEYETDKAYVGECGFHACENPIDTMGYYPPRNGSRYFVVKQSGQLSHGLFNSNVASTKIKVITEVGVLDMVKAAIAYAKGNCVKEKKNFKEGEDHVIATDVRTAVFTDGVGGAAIASGGHGIAYASGDYGASVATGPWEIAHSSGPQSIASATNTRGVAYAAGKESVASATDFSGIAATDGDMGIAAASGRNGFATTEGEWGVACASGVFGSASAEGKNAVAMASGYHGIAKAALGCVICLVERNENYGDFVAARAEVVDGERIKADTWYTLKNGEFVEVF